MALEGAIEHWHMAPSGLGVAITVEVGEVYLVVANPDDHTLFGISALLVKPKTRGVPLSSRCEALVLEANNRV